MALPQARHLLYATSFADPRRGGGGGGGGGDGGDGGGGDERVGAAEMKGRAMYKASSFLRGREILRSWIRMTHHHRVSLQAEAEERVLLHFGAVDWRCAVYVNGVLAGAHVGGYDARSLLAKGFIPHRIPYPTP